MVTTVSGAKPVVGLTGWQAGGSVVRTLMVTSPAVTRLRKVRDWLFGVGLAFCQMDDSGWPGFLSKDRQGRQPVIPLTAKEPKKEG